MIDFDLSDEQKDLQRLARQFAEKEMAPVAVECDRKGEFPLHVFQKAHEVGLVNLNIPPEYDGPGLSLVDECVVGEEFGWGCSGIGASLGLNALAALPLNLAGNDDQKKKYFGRLVRDRQLAAYCLTEPSAGSDVVGIQATAKKVGNEYVLNGTKQFITNGSLAHWYIVFAYTDKEAKHKGISCFIVDRDWKGVSVGKKEDKLGQRASDLAQVIFEDVRVPEANRVGADGQGFYIAMNVFNRSRCTVSMLAVGVMRRALECSIEYANTRQAFGQPISSLQAVGFMIAEMATLAEASRLLCYKAAHIADKGQRNSTEAAYAKWFAGDSCMKVTTDAVQVFGGYGFLKEYPVEKLMRDAKIFQIYEGTSQVQKVIIAKDLCTRR